jgi:hypothetical protein
MSEQDNGAEAINSEEVIIELPTGVDDPMVLREELAKQTEARRQILARAKRAEADLKAMREQGIRAEVKPDTTIKSEYTLNDEVVDLRLDGFSKQDVEFIMKNGGRKALEDKNSYTSIAINARKEQAKAEAAANKTVDTSGMSELERKYTPEMMKNMTAKELKNILPHA